MNIQTISYQRVQNLGNYESQRFEATANVVEGEDPQVAFEALKAYVESQLGIKREANSLDDDMF